MAKDLDLKIRISAELTDIKRALQGMQKDMAKVGGAADKATKQATKGVSKLEAGIKTARRQVAGFVAAWASISTVKSIVRIADEYKQISARLKLVTESGEEFNRVQSETFKIAQQTRTSLGETVSLYTRIARATKESNLTTRDRLQITENINKAIKVSGASQESANAALVQLGQGLSSGALRGEELNSVLEQTPRIAQAIADGLGIDIATLREWGATGKLSAEEVAKALLSQSKAINEEFQQIPVTVAGAIQTVSNAWTKYIGEADEAAGATRALSEVILWAGENLAKLIEFVLRAGAVIVTAFAAKGAAAVVKYATAVNAATIANTRFAASLGVINKAFRLLFSALIGWQIGDYLRQEFLIVEQAGIATVAALTRAWTELVFFFKRAGAGMRYFFTAPLDFIRDAIDDFLEYLAGVAEEMPFVGDEIRDAFKSAASYIKPASDETKRYRNEIKALNEEMERELRILDQAAVNALLKAEERRYSKSDKTKPPPVEIDLNDNTEKNKKAVAETIALVKDEIDRALTELDRLKDENLISYEKYFAKRRGLMTEAIDAEIAAKKKALDAEEDVNKRSKILTELIILEQQRKDIAVASAHEQAEAEQVLADKLEQVKTRLLELEGKTGEARARQIEDQYKDLIARMTAENDEEGLALVRKLVNVEEARARLDQLKSDFSTAVQDMQATEQSIQAQADVGTITQLQAESQLIALRDSSIEQLQALRDATKALYDETKDPEVGRALQNMDTNLAQMSTKANAYAETLKASLQGNLKTALIEISEDTDNVSDAFRNMAQNVIRSIRDMAAELLAKSIIKNLFSGLAAGGAAGAGGGAGGWAALMAAFVQHSGGMAGAGRVRRVPALAFAGAPRLHSGGYIKDDEVPAILQTGEEVLSKDDPRNMANGGAQGTRVINVIDPNLVHDYLASSEGERTIINTLRRNAGTARQILV